MVAGRILGILDVLYRKSSSLFTRIILFKKSENQIFNSNTSLAELVKQLPSKQQFIGSSPIGCHFQMRKN